MDTFNISKLLRREMVEIDPTDVRDAIEIGVAVGHIGLIHRCTELSGTFDHFDIQRMRREGLVVVATGFGQAVYEAVPASELEV